MRTKVIIYYLIFFKSSLFMGSPMNGSSMSSKVKIEICLNMSQKCLFHYLNEIQQKINVITQF